jgi:hypothetical protein
VGSKVIGSGLGRTGTASLKQALERLGFDPCHHMKEVLDHPESVPLWVEAFEGRPDWDAIFRGYWSAVDAPTCKFWRELSACYPEAKIVHTLRQPDEWFDAGDRVCPRFLRPQPNAPLSTLFRAYHRVYTEGGIHDRIFMTEYLRRHNAEVAQNIPKHRLLIYEIAEGWEPLCSFLGVPTPAAPFPFTNTRGEFPFEMRLAMRRERPKETRNWRRPCRRFCLATLL